MFPVAIGKLTVNEVPFTIGESISFAEIFELALMNKVIRIGTRESQLAVWQATQVKDLLTKHGFSAELVYIKSEGDIDLKTPLYEMGVQGIFTRSLDIALLNERIDIAVHSLKDVPTQLPNGIITAAVLERASYKDLLVYKNGDGNSRFTIGDSQMTIATSSIRRKAQWLNRYPNHTIENLRGNVNTRLQKLADSHWNGAIFAAAGLERIEKRPEQSIELDWMLPAPATQVWSRSSGFTGSFRAWSRVAKRAGVRARESRSGPRAASAGVVVRSSSVMSSSAPKRRRSQKCRTCPSSSFRRAREKRGGVASASVRSHLPVMPR